MTKAQIKAAQTIANDYSFKASSVPGYFIDDEISVPQAYGFNRGLGTAYE